MTSLRSHATSARDWANSAARHAAFLCADDGEALESAASELRRAANELKREADLICIMACNAARAAKEDVS